LNPVRDIDPIWEVAMPPKQEPVGTFAALPDPGQASTLDGLVERLRLLKVWAGDPSYECITGRVNTAWTAVGRPLTWPARPPW
jgi:hypothetical protein